MIMYLRLEKNTTMGNKIKLKLNSKPFKYNFGSSIIEVKMISSGHLQKMNQRVENKLKQNHIETETSFENFKNELLD